MLKRIITVLLALALCAPLTAGAANKSEIYGFDDMGWPTDTKNEYYINTGPVVTIRYNELDDNPDYTDIFAGSTMYIPIYVYNDGKNPSVIATTKQISSDKVEVSCKATAGEAYVGDISVIDGKKLKNSGLESGAYIAVPFAEFYPLIGKTRIKLTLVLSVNGMPFQESRTTLTCSLNNKEEIVDKNSIYGVETPMKYTTANNYSGEATFDFGSNIKYTGKVKAREKFYLALDRRPNSGIVNMYSGSGVYLDFYSFPGSKDTFSSTGKLDIPVDRSKLTIKSSSGSSSRSSGSSSSSSSSSESSAPTESLYVYKISGNNLTALGGKDISFDSKTNVLTIHTKTLDSYVLSNQPLKKEVDPGAQGSGILKSGYAYAAPADLTRIYPGAM